MRPVVDSCIRDDGLSTEDDTEYDVSWQPAGHGVSRSPPLPFLPLPTP